MGAAGADHDEVTVAGHRAEVEARRSPACTARTSSTSADRCNELLSPCHKPGAEPVAILVCGGERGHELNEVQRRGKRLRNLGINLLSNTMNE